MEEDNLDSNIRHWLLVHKNVRSQIRRLTVFLAVLAIFALAQGFRHQADLNQDYQYAREFSLQLISKGPRSEIAALYNRICSKEDSVCESGPIVVELKSIPDIRWELDRFLQEKHPADRYKFQGLEFDFAVYALLLICVPLGILLLLLMRLRTTEKIAVILRDHSGAGGEVQQCINSIFSERATQNIGDQRWAHAVLWTLALIALSVLPGFFLVFETSLVLNTKVLINNAGMILPLPDASLQDRTYVRTADDNILIVFLIYLSSVFVLAGLIFKTILKQLSQP